MRRNEALFMKIDQIKETKMIKLLLDLITVWQIFVCIIIIIYGKFNFLYPVVLVIINIVSIILYSTILYFAIIHQKYTFTYSLICVVFFYLLMFYFSLPSFKKEGVTMIPEDLDGNPL